METIQTEKQQPEIINASEESVKVLLAKLRKIKIEKDVAIGSDLLHLQELQDEIHTKSLPFDQQHDTVVVEIRSIMPAIAKTMKTADGMVSYRKGYTKVSWDTKALDACTDDYVMRAILPYRKVTEVAPSIGEPEIY